MRSSTLPGGALNADLITSGRSCSRRSIHAYPVYHAPKVQLARGHSSLLDSCSLQSLLASSCSPPRFNADLNSQQQERFAGSLQSASVASVDDLAIFVGVLERNRAEGAVEERCKSSGVLSETKQEAGVRNTLSLPRLCRDVPSAACLHRV